MGYTQALASLSPQDLLSVLGQVLEGTPTLPHPPWVWLSGSPSLPMGVESLCPARAPLTLVVPTLSAAAHLIVAQLAQHPVFLVRVIEPGA